MSQRCLLLILHLISASFAASAATLPLYTISSPVTAPPDVAPQIDARAVVNNSVFAINKIGTNVLPFQTLNNLDYTNNMLVYGHPGFRWDYYDLRARRLMNTWVNRGEIYSYDTNGYGSAYYNDIYGYYDPANWLLVYATNLVSPGFIGADDSGLVRLEGKKIDLTRGRIRSGSPITQRVSVKDTSLGATNYVNDKGVYDEFWATGSNNVVRGNGNRMVLDGAQPSFTLPYVISPSFQVNYGGVNPMTYTLSSPYMNAVAYTNHLSATSSVVQVVFYPTNSYFGYGGMSNVTTSVMFYPEDDDGATVMVGFHEGEFDTVLEVWRTNSMYLLDALAFNTNRAVIPNRGDPLGRRPATFELSRTVPLMNGDGFWVPPNAEYTNTMLYNPSYLSNSVRVQYAAYGASWGNARFGTTPYDPYTGNYIDPTNMAGRVEIWGDDVNMNQARIRGESSIMIKAANLTGNRMAKVDAPNLNFDVGTSQPQLVISNIAPSDVHRFSGAVYAWSALWQNTETNLVSTNTIRFHVLMVEPMFYSVQPVMIHRFAARATNGMVRVTDQVNAQRSLTIESRDLHVKGTLVFPQGASWANTNVINVINMTNEGIISVPGGVASLGADRAERYRNVVNRGTNVAQSQYIRAEYVENPGILGASAGVVNIEADKVRVEGAPMTVFTNIGLDYTYFPPVQATNVVTNSLSSAIVAMGPVTVKAQSMAMSNAFIQAGAGLQGTLSFSVTGDLVDAGPGAVNMWLSSEGIQMVCRPQRSELLGTWAKTTLGVSRSGLHVWPGLNFGPKPCGFTNNLALGKMTLDGASGSLFQFQGAGADAALYVDYLEFLNNATNYLSALEFLDPPVTIYFANASIPPSKLDGLYNGRLRWVKDYAGPLSSTNFVEMNNTTFPPTVVGTNTYNIALAQSRDRDDDGDGTVNGEDPDPFFTGSRFGLTIARSKLQPPQVVLSWEAMGRAANHVEYRSMVGGTSAWQTLLITNKPFTQRVTITDTINDKTNGPNHRLYRIRVEPLSP